MRLRLVPLLASLCLGAALAEAEDEGGPKNRALSFQFLPPPLDDAKYSIGVFDAKGVLVRRLHEGAAESVFPAALNGLVVKWDAKDDAGKRVPNGKYELRGWAVAPLKVSGVATRGNDWLADDPRLRVAKVELTRFDAGGVAMANAQNVAGEKFVIWLGGEKVRVLPLPADAPGDVIPNSTDRFGSPWSISDSGASQTAEGGPARELPNLPSDPPFSAVIDNGAELIATTQFAPAANWQRTRILKAAPEKGGWEPIFERNIRVPQTWSAPEAAPTLALELVRNPFARRTKGNPIITVRAVADASGTHLAADDGLRLRTVSEARAVQAVALAPGAKKGAVRFFQRDAAVSEEFLLEGCERIMAVEIGRCELGDQGEIEPPAE